MKSKSIGIWLICLSSAFVSGAANACIVAIRPEIVVRGIRLSPPPDCSKCGPRVLALEVISGEPKQVYQLEYGSDAVIICYAKSTHAGQQGTFGLMNHEDRYTELSFSETSGR